ncbi:GNAT family N-acetyltransferase [Viridibacillus sp. NPDC093762]|uniref:GNAT family N-acetyltransferase n=1 Tax=Viridibacillus sp. NPDC093762 TaxID=3390720 RepID=UPI003D027748
MIRMATALDIEQLAHFLSSCNETSRRHIGYCGQDEKEIRSTLRQEFSDLPFENSMIIAVENEQIVAAIGLDFDEDNQSAEVWGPFVQNEVTEVLLPEMWMRLCQQLPIALENPQFFINIENEVAIAFTKNIGAKMSGHHYILHKERQNHKFESTKEIVKLDSINIEAFQNLHDLAFPNTYYNAQMILSRLNKNQVVFCYCDNEGLKGYVYIEANAENGEGTIEYIAVNDQFRKQGIGRKLLLHGLDFLFTYDSIEEISLTVQKNERGAIHLYQSAGFNIVHELVFMK